MSWSSLPEDLWKLILTHVSLEQRLGTCSRVSQKLCRAAVAATEQLQVQLRRNVQRSEGLKRWLQHSGQHVSSLQLEGLSGDLTQLPCPQLQQLCVWDGAVLLGPSSNQPGILHSCSGLTKLEFRGRILDVCQSLSALSAVPALQHLELSPNNADNISMPGSILQVLTQLTCMRLDQSIAVKAESLQHISALQHLQVLDLCQPTTPLSPSSTPGLAQLTALTSFRLCDGDLEAAVLQPYRNLQSLRLESCSLTGGTSAAAALLSVIGRQLQLRELFLLDLQCEWPTTPAACRALTASSRLQELLFMARGLPAGILQAVLRPEQQLPELTALGICKLFSVGEAPLTSCYSHADISRLVRCCPGLCDLYIELQPDVQLQALSQLTGLTRLRVSWVTEASVTSLQYLSGLKHLTVADSQTFSSETLLCLTALRGLTNLLTTQRDSVEIHLKSSKQDPDVWLQLQEYCDT